MGLSSHKCAELQNIPEQGIFHNECKVFLFKISYPKLTGQCVQLQWLQECNLLLFIIQKHLLVKRNCSCPICNICLLVSKIRLCVVYYCSRAQHSAYVGKKVWQIKLFMLVIINKLLKNPLGILKVKTYWTDPLSFLISKCDLQTCSGLIMFNGGNEDEDKWLIFSKTYWVTVKHI